jgi:hypothetical protein
MLSISDNYGRIRADFTDEELDPLSEDQRAALVLVIKSARAAEAAEATERECDQDTHRLARAVADAEAALWAGLPKPDPVTEIKRVAETQRRVALGLDPLPPVEIKGAAKLETAVRKAHAALEASRERGFKVKAELRTKRAALAEALTAWQAVNPPMRTEDHIREHLARTAAYNAKVASGEIVPNEPAPFTPMSHLDAIMNTQGNNGSVNVGYGRRHAARGLRPVRAR